MFYCDPCAEKNGWPMSLRRSQGKCEMCDKVDLCNDTPSSQLPLPKRRRKQMHRHICGLRNLSASLNGDEPPKNIDGCGFIWEHVRLTGVSDQAYSDNHLCPNCGIGPWYTVADSPEDLRRALSPTPPVIGMRAVLRPNPDNPTFVPRHELKAFYEYARARADMDELLQGVERLLGDGPMAVAFGKDVVVIDIDNHSISGYNLADILPARRRR